MNFRLPLLAGALLLLARPGPGAAQATPDSAAPTARAAESPVDTAAAQLLRPGDVVQLRIWREPDLSGEYQVDETGTAVFPLLGDMRVTELSPAALKERLVDGYTEYLRDPAIDITLLRRVNVLGSVTRPGLYRVDPTMTVADAIALAGGATPAGDPDKVRLLREGDVLTAKLSRRTRISELPIRSGDQFYVPERSWLARNSNIVAAAITGSVSLVIALIINAN